MNKVDVPAANENYVGLCCFGFFPPWLLSVLQLRASNSLVSGCAAKQHPVFISLFIFKSVPYLLISHFICFASMRSWFAKCIAAQFIAGKLWLTCAHVCVFVCMSERVHACMCLHTSVFTLAVTVCCAHNMSRWLNICQSGFWPGAPSGTRLLSHLVSGRRAHSPCECVRTAWPFRTNSPAQSISTCPSSARKERWRHPPSPHTIFLALGNRMTPLSLSLI